MGQAKTGTIDGIIIKKCKIDENIQIMKKYSIQGLNGTPNCTDWHLIGICIKYQTSNNIYPTQAKMLAGLGKNV